MKIRQKYMKIRQSWIHITLIYVIYDNHRLILFGNYFA